MGFDAVEAPCGTVAGRPLPRRRRFACLTRCGASAFGSLWAAFKFCEHNPGDPFLPVSSCCQDLTSAQTPDRIIISGRLVFLEKNLVEFLGV